MVGARSGIVTVLALGIAVWMSVGSNAWAQSSDLQTLVDRLARLERDIRTLNTTVYKGEKPPASASAGASIDSSTSARLGVRISELEGEVRAATGTVETLAYDIRQLNERLDRMMADIDYRLSALGGSPAAGQQAAAQGTMPQVGKALTVQPVTRIVPGAKPQSSFGTVTEAELKAVSDKAPVAVEVEGAQPGAAAVAKTVVPAKTAPIQTAKIQTAKIQTATVEPVAAQAKVSTPPGALPAGTTKEQYDFARKFLMKGKFDQAEAALSEFLKANPKDPLAGNARYWLGETHYVRGDYLKAAEIFLEGYREDPKGSKAPDGLLKLGMALGQLGKKPQACATFGKLVKEFPKASKNLLKVAAREKKRNGCG